MQAITVQMHIAIAEAKEIVDRTEGTITDKLKAAMTATRDHWMCTDEDQQFRSAVGAVMLHYGENSQEFERLKGEMQGLAQLSAAINAAQVGVGIDLSSLAELSEGYEPIGLMKMWREIKKSGGR